MKGNAIKMEEVLIEGYPVTKDMSVDEVIRAYELRMLTLKAIKEATENSMFNGLFRKLAKEQRNS